MSVCVVMPAWNEAEGIAEFLVELDGALREWGPQFMVVDDCSTDATRKAVEAVAANGVKVAVTTNEANSGHGPSTLRALELGLLSGADVVVSLDGDGQFLGVDVARVVGVLTAGDLDVAEGVRTSRSDPGYRKAVTSATRLLVWSRTRKWPSDANTPLRAYRPAALTRLLEAVPDQAMTPNLIISVLCRTGSIRYAEVSVVSRPRRGSSAVGTSWGRGSTMPSRRFLRFCRGAVAEWVHAPTRLDP